MIDHDLFLKRIQEATPDELVLAQGIYGDWLEEQGDVNSSRIRMLLEVQQTVSRGQTEYVSGPFIERLTSLPYIGPDGRSYWQWARDARLPLIGIKRDRYWAVTWMPRVLPGQQFQVGYQPANYGGVSGSLRWDYRDWAWVYCNNVLSPDPNPGAYATTIHPGMAPVLSYAVQSEFGPIWLMLENRAQVEIAVESLPERFWAYPKGYSWN